MASRDAYTSKEAKRAKEIKEYAEGWNKAWSDAYDQSMKKQLYSSLNKKAYRGQGVIGVKKEKMDSLRPMQEWSRSWNDNFHDWKYPRNLLGPAPFNSDEYKKLSSTDKELVNRYQYNKHWTTERGKLPIFNKGTYTTVFNEENARKKASEVANKVAQEWVEEYWNKR